MVTGGEWLWHISILALVIGMMFINRTLSGRRLERRTALEADRLRTALAAELRVLEELYRVNLDLLDKKTGYVLSTRSPLLILRGNLGRLTLLESSVIEQLVALFAHNEMMEAHIAAVTRPRVGLSYRLTRESNVEDMSQMYATAAEDLERARATLDRLEAARPSPIPVRWIDRIWNPGEKRKSAAAERPGIELNADAPQRM
jgi:hypothetical protein